MVTMSPGQVLVAMDRMSVPAGPDRRDIEEAKYAAAVVYNHLRAASLPITRIAQDRTGGIELVVFEDPSVGRVAVAVHPGGNVEEPLVVSARAVDGPGVAPRSLFRRLTRSRKAYPRRACVREATRDVERALRWIR